MIRTVCAYYMISAYSVYPCERNLVVTELDYEPSLSLIMLGLVETCGNVRNMCKGAEWMRTEWLALVP